MSDDVVIQKTADAQTQPHLTQRLADALSPAKLTETGKNAALKLTYASRAAKERLANSYVFNLRSLLGSHPALDRDRSEELFLQNRTVHYNAKLTEHENGDRVLGISMFIFSVERGNIDGVSAVYRGMPVSRELPPIVRQLLQAQ